MKINGFDKLTLLDYPSKIACIIFTAGCNYNCSFCQNADLIPLTKEGFIKEEEIFAYLNKRHNVIDGIVISGGEPTIQKDLKNFIKKLKEYKILVKLDTNGSNPKILKELINENLIDYVAMDIKNIFDEYSEIIRIPNVKIANIKESINILKNSKIDHEFRTTIMKEYHDFNKIKKICSYLGANEKYYLQNFVLSERVNVQNLTPFSKEELKEIEQKLIKDFPNVKVRGL
jgi:pyruvate formate lyase activating enzyme